MKRGLKRGVKRRPRATPPPQTAGKPTGHPALGDVLARKRHMRLRLLLFLVIVLAPCALSGCIRPKLIVDTVPSGGTVYFQNQERGDAPIVIPFIWHWYYKVRVEKKGYKTVEKIEFLPPPPWFLMPLDFAAEVLPIPVPDNHKRRYVLEPLPQDSTVPPAVVPAPAPAAPAPAAGPAVTP